MTLRPVPEISLGRLKAKVTGEVGRFITAPIKGLVVDGRYQRVFQVRNEKRVLALATNWDWSLYTPIIVAAVEGKFAIIDGQHRAAAALALGFAELPAWLSAADEIAQARAFLAINASPTRVDALQLWNSRHAAGDLDAILLWDVCIRAGVEISRHPVAAAFRKPNVTLAPGALHELRLSVGKETLARALEIVVKVGQAQKTSLITRHIVRAIARLADSSWKDLDVESIATGLALVDFLKVIAQATLEAKDTGRATTDCLCEAINARLAEALAEAA